jgi:DNA-binding Lrp family transcriptional regulator
MNNQTEVNKESFKEAFPELYREIEQEGFSSGFAAGKKQPEKQPEKQLTLEETLKAEWDRDPSIRAEFENFEQYSAFMRNKEKIRIAGKEV